jgi:hypothetical protein
VTDPWATTQNTSTTAPQSGGESSNLAESFAGEGSQLFGGGGRPTSLFNQTHLLGSERTGIITTAPYDVHSTDYNTKKPKYWGTDRKPVLVSTDPATGEKLRPVKDTVIELDTEYRQSQEEATALGKDFNPNDDGARAATISGQDLKTLRKEIGRLGIRSEAEMVGLRFTMKRAAQKPNPGGRPSWINEITLSRP